MIVLEFCPSCNGEGRKNVPRYDFRTPSVPIRFKPSGPCPDCGGSGYVGKVF